MKKALTLLAASALFAVPATAQSIDMSKHNNMDSMSTNFSHYDADNDGQVSFKEFSKHAKAMNMSTTKAAQLFMKMTGGSPTLTQSSFQSAALSNPDGFLSSTRNTAVLNATTTGMSSVGDTRMYNGMRVNTDAGIDSTSPMTDMPSQRIMDGESTYNDFERTGQYDEPMKQGENMQMYNGMRVNPDAGIDSTSPMTDMPSDRIMDSESTYDDFETTGQYDEPLGN